ncbi:spike base protein, RCAP_Rcc01079 family [Ancylobacter terrae]|uniref:spike base protein, RCAP_Rcc01079 family n=1 Tax=Ancylobacter sp. sgz301288 TaxID=3342077 RepID=UPI00385F3CFC
MAARVNDIASTLESFGRKSSAITPSDSTDLPSAPVKAVILITAGDISIIPADNANNDPVSFTGQAAGFIPPFIVRRVMATGTTATVRTIEN